MRLILLLFIFALSGQAAGNNGLIEFETNHSFKETVSKIESLLKEKGFTIFAIVDHAKNAQKAGLSLKPNTVFIFGNPKVGTPIMKKSTSVGIDLPVKIHVRSTAKSTVVIYNDPVYIAKRHGINPELAQIKKMAKALEAIAKKTIK